MLVNDEYLWHCGEAENAEPRLGNRGSHVLPRTGKEKGRISGSARLSCAAKAAIRSFSSESVLTPNGRSPSRLSRATLASETASYLSGLQHPRCRLEQRVASIEPERYRTIALHPALLVFRGRYARNRGSSRSQAVSSRPLACERTTAHQAPIPIGGCSQSEKVARRRSDGRRA